MSENAAPDTQYPIHNDDEDRDSAVGDIEAIAFNDDGSVTSEARDYIEESGRRYHADWYHGQYLLPNDAKEQERLDVQHQLLLYMDGLHKAPLQEVIQRVLDVGTGTGCWAIDFAENFPSAIITAVDISPDVMPDETYPSCKFLLDDAEHELGLGSNEYDYINVRLLHGFRNPSRFIAHALDALVPGGYVEIKEFELPLLFHDPETATDSALTTWSTVVVGGAMRLGIDLTITKRISTILRDEGFEEIRESDSVWPIGAWAEKRKKRDLGAMLQRYWLETMEALAWRPFREMGWQKEETAVLLAKLRNEISSKEIRSSMRVRTFWARKPKSA